MTSMILATIEQLKQSLKTQLPAEAKISSVELEGPFLVVYSRRPEILMEDGTTIKNLAKNLRKRIVIRSDPKIRLSENEAEEKIKGIVPEEAEITGMNFDTTLGEVTIEARKPGLVIGKDGTTLREITSAVYWRAQVVRTPPLQSQLIAQIRHILATGSAKRKRALLAMGQRIHRPYVYDHSDWIRITGLGGCSEVGRSALLLSTPESKVLVDCGVSVGTNDPSEAFPIFSAPEFDIDSLDAVIITHSHLDHCGALPFLFKYGYRGPVYCNDATLSLMTLLQNDYLQVAKSEGKLLPYAHSDVKRVILNTITRRYGEVTDLSPDVRLTLTPAGHILGSSIVHLHIGDGQYNLAIAQDFKYGKTRLLDPANARFPRLETVILESTYGSSKDTTSSRKEAESYFLGIVNQTIKGGGKVLIPSLAVGRAQELMIVIDRYMHTGLMEQVPVYIDGLISEATAIHTCHPEYLSHELQNMIFNAGQNPFLSEWFTQVDNRDTRDEIIGGEPCIIMATSGMLTGGSSVEYFLNLCDDPRNSIIFVSYQAEKTLGRRVQSGIREIRTFRHGHMDLVQVKMQVHSIDGFSGHSDRRELMNYVRKLSPRPENVILVHGQYQKSMSFATSLAKRYRMNVRVPRNLETIRLM